MKRDPTVEALGFSPAISRRSESGL